jgi:hypothetical protein
VSNRQSIEVSDRLKAELDDVLALSRKSSLASSMNGLNAKQKIEEDPIYFTDFTKSKNPVTI